MVDVKEWREYEAHLLEELRKDPAGELEMLNMTQRYTTSFWLVRVLNRWLGEIMARGKGQVKESSNGSPASWTRFVDISAAGVPWVDVVQHFGSADAVADGVSSLCTRGYRVGLSFNEANDAFIASVTCKAVDDPNSGCTFTAFAGTWFEALALACYKHYVLAREDWNSAGSAAGRPSFG